MRFGDSFYLKIIPTRGEPVDLEITPRRLKALIAGAASLILVGLAGLIGAGFALAQASSAARLRAENARLRAENQQLSQAYALLDTAISKEREIRTILGLQQKPAGFENLPRGMYIGDVSNPETWQLKRLLTLSKQETEELSRISEQLKSDIAARKNLPSIAPAAGVFTSGFGYRRDPVYGGWRFHKGIDIAAPRGTPVVATADGVVARVGWNKGYGLAVEIDHGNGISTYYAHCSRAAVSPGMKVHRGDVIAYIGSTGKATGPHVHYEVRVKGVARNPEKYILTASNIEYD